MMWEIICENGVITSSSKLDWSFKSNVLLFIHKANFNNELVSYTCITLLKLDKLKGDLEINS